MELLVVYTSSNADRQSVRHEWIGTFAPDTALANTAAHLAWWPKPALLGHNAPDPRQTRCSRCQPSVPGGASEERARGGQTQVEHRMGSRIAQSLQRIPVETQFKVFCYATEPSELPIVAARSPPVKVQGTDPRPRGRDAGVRGRLVDDLRPHVQRCRGHRGHQLQSKPLRASVPPTPAADTGARPLISLHSVAVTRTRFTTQSAHSQPRLRSI